uniref:Uncharacterized protein n=1 Tax=Arundo donax TaxID=35708 RepID=A0A0A9HZA3_ARUDO
MNCLLIVDAAFP